MKLRALAPAAALLLAMPLSAQRPDTIVPAEHLVLRGIPALPAALREAVRRYTEFRSAAVVDWHPLRRELLISTRFGNTAQLHRVARPGGDRSQLTFFDEPVGAGSWSPDGRFLVLGRDAGGNEFTQLYRQEVPGGGVTLLTDGAAQNRRGAVVPDGQPHHLRLHPPQRRGPRPVRDGPARSRDQSPRPRGAGRRLERAGLVARRRGAADPGGPLGQPGAAVAPGPGHRRADPAHPRCAGRHRGPRRRPLEPGGARHLLHHRRGERVPRLVAAGARQRAGHGAHAGDPVGHHRICAVARRPDGGPGGQRGGALATLPCSTPQAAGSAPCPGCRWAWSAASSGGPRAASWPSR